MIDVTRLDEVLRRGGEVAKIVEDFQGLERRRKELQGSLDELRAERNAANQRMARADKKSAEFAAERDTLRDLSQQIKTAEAELADVEERSRSLHMVIPNAPHSSVPEGQGDAHNREVSVWGDKPR